MVWMTVINIKNNLIINIYFYLGAPGVEMEFVNCDDNTLRDIVESSIVLNEIILNMKRQKY